MNRLHMETEVVCAVVQRLKRALHHMSVILAELQRRPPTLSWWAGGEAPHLFEAELRRLEGRLRWLLEEGWHLTHRLEAELREWEAADAVFGNKTAWQNIWGFLTTAGQALVAGFTSLWDTVAHGLDRLVAWVSDPVDIREGTYVYESVDLILLPGEPFVLKRVYTSRWGRAGWYFSLPFTLTPIGPHRVWLQLGTLGGLVVRFQRERDGQPWRSSHPGYRLTTTREGFQVHLPRGEVLVFSRQGVWQTWIDALGQRVDVEHPDPHIWRFRAPWGALWAEIHLDARGHVLEALDEEGRRLRYRYDDKGNLVAFIDRNGHTTRYEYTEQGLLTRVIGPQGQVLLENEYDDQGRVRLQRDAEGQTTYFVYKDSPESGQIRQAVVTYPDSTQVRFTLQHGQVIRQQVAQDAIHYRRNAQGYIVEIQDPNGKVWHLQWDKAGRLTDLSDPAGHTYRFRYDKYGAVEAFHDPAGNQVQVEYDEQHRPVRLRFPDGAEVQFEYDDAGRMTAWVDPLGRRISFTYDALGRVARIRLPDGTELTYTYDHGQVVETDALGHRTVYTYDGEDRLLTMRRDGYEIRFSYTPDGHLAALEDTRGRVLEVEHNRRGQPIALRFRNGYTLRQVYDALGRPVEVRDASGRTLLKRLYDARGRLRALVDARGHAWHYTYDGVGNLIALTDRKGRTTRFEYDEAYRLVRIYDPEGRVQAHITYDERNLPVRITDASGRVLGFSFDPLGRLIATNWDGLEARAELDAAGQLVRLVDEKGRERLYAYDAQGRLTREIYPLKHTYTYAYDPRGRLRTQTLPDGTYINLDYDALDRPTALVYTRADRKAQVHWRYSQDGRELTIVDASGEVHYRYLSQANALERRDVFGRTVQYFFTPAGHLQRLVYPDGKEVTYEYDDNGNLITIRDFMGHETRIEYDANDLPVRVIHPGGLMTIYEYDLLDRVVRICHLNARGERLVEQRIQRDATGRTVDIKVEGPALEGLKRGPNARDQRRFTFNALDQIIATDEGPFQYDARGNLIAYRDAGQSVTLHYDLQDRLVEARLDGVHLRYAYDPEGNRVAVTRNGRTRRYVLDTVLDLPRPLVEMDEDGRIVRYYIWGAGLQYALDAEGRPYVYLFNHRGDTLAVVDGEGRVVAAYDYAAYGQVVGWKGTLEIPFQFLGRWGVMTDHPGLVYIRARYYAPRLGVFTQPDRLHVRAPIPRFLNRYAYALDEPWDLVDVDGRIANIIAGAIVGGIIGAAVETGMQIMEHGLNVAAWDGAAIAGAAVGGAVSGAIMSTGIGAVPIVGAAIAGGVGSVADQLTQNFFKGVPLTQDLGASFLVGSITGGVIDAAPLLWRAGRAGLMAGLHGQSALDAARRSSVRWWTQEVAIRQAERQALEALNKRMWRAFQRSKKYHMGIVSTAMAPFKAFWRGGIRDRVFIYGITHPLLDMGEWRDEILSNWLADFLFHGKGG